MRKLPPDEKRRRANTRWKQWADKNREHVRTYHREYRREYICRDGVRDKINARRRASYPEEWKRLTPEQRKAANERIKLWRQNNLEHTRAKGREQYWKHHESIRRKLKNRTSEQRQGNRKYNREWYAKEGNLNYRIALCLRARLRCALLNASAKKRSSACDLLGCSIEDFKIYIESKFEPGMTWENRGRGSDKWHLDHIVPCAIFDLSKLYHQKRCFHFSNYQPLWEPQNLSKGAKISEGHQFDLL